MKKDIHVGKWCGWCGYKHTSLRKAAKCKKKGIRDCIQKTIAEFFPELLR